MLSPPKPYPIPNSTKLFFVPEEIDSKFGDFGFPRLFGLPPVGPNVRPPNIGKFDPLIDCFAARTTLDRGEDDLGHNIFFGGAPLLPLIFGAYFSCLFFRRILVGKLGSRRHTLGSFPNCGSSNVVLYCIAGEPLPPSSLTLLLLLFLYNAHAEGKFDTSLPPLFSQIYFLHLGERDGREIIAIFYID